MEKTGGEGRQYESELFERITREQFLWMGCLLRLERKVMRP